MFHNTMRNFNSTNSVHVKNPQNDKLWQMINDFNNRKAELADEQEEAAAIEEKSKFQKMLNVQLQESA